MLSHLVSGVIKDSCVGYIDGGTGSMLIQAAIAGFVTSAFFLKTKWAAVKSAVAGMSRKHDASNR